MDQHKRLLSLSGRIICCLLSALSSLELQSSSIRDSPDCRDGAGARAASCPLEKGRNDFKADSPRGSDARDLTMMACHPDRSHRSAVRLPQSGMQMQQLLSISFYKELSLLLCEQQLCCLEEE